MNKSNSDFNLEFLKEQSKAFQNLKVLVGITCNPEFYEHLKDYLNHTFQMTEYTDENYLGNKNNKLDFRGVPYYKIVGQKDLVKYFYEGDKLKEYLKNNI